MRGFLLKHFWGLLLIDVIAVCVCIFASLRWVKVRRLSLSSGKIKNSVRVVFVSDIHGRSPRKINIDIWKRIKSMRGVDIVLIGGDVVTRGPQELIPHLEGIASVARHIPIAYVDGNHDAHGYCSISRMLRNRGVHVLKNRRLDISLRHNDISIIGIRDHSFLKAFGFHGADAALSSIDPSKLNICLSHQPQIFDRRTKSAPDLYLCGHTHGGQIRLPFFPTLFAPNQGILPKYGYGWYYKKDSRMFVSKGIGATDFPIRFWNRPEMCVIDITPN